MRRDRVSFVRVCSQWVAEREWTLLGELFLRRSVRIDNIPSSSSHASVSLPIHSCSSQNLCLQLTPPPRRTLHTAGRTASAGAAICARAAQCEHVACVQLGSRQRCWLGRRRPERCVTVHRRVGRIGIRHAEPHTRQLCPPKNSDQFDIFVSPVKQKSKQNCCLVSDIFAVFQTNRRTDRGIDCHSFFAHRVTPHLTPLSVSQRRPPPLYRATHTIRRWISPSH